MRFFYTIFATIVVFCSPAFACLGPQFEDHHFPSCTIPLPAADDVVSVIDGDAPFEFSTHHLGEPNSVTLLVTLHIAENDQKNYLVLSAKQQTIWRFTGDIESVSRVIVLGAANFGPDRAAVIGLSADRITFTSPDLSALDGIQQTSCTYISNACTPTQWFGDEPGERTFFYPEPQQSRQRLDTIVSRHSLSLKNSGDVISIVTPNSPGALVSIDPASVISPNGVQPYEILPGFPGLEALLASGALIPANEGEYRDIVQTYGEKFSKRYRSRFDPDFLLVPTVDYIVTREITLPPQFPPATLMVANGVSAPNRNGNSNDRVCLYFEDKASEPARGKIFSSNLCRLKITSDAIPDDEDDILWASAMFDQLKTGIQECQSISLPDASHIVAIALAEGPHRRYRGDPIRRIDVEVTRDEPTVLYVSMEGGPVQWNITGNQVVEVFGREPASLGYNEVLINGMPYAYSQLASDLKGCPQQFDAPAFPYRLGPFIAQLDEMFDLLTGQRIDELITFTDSGKAWRDPEWPTPVYVIE